MNRATLMNNIAVLIDQLTKDTVETITYDVLAKHVVVLTDIRELGDEHYHSAVVIFEPSFSVIVTPEILKEIKEKFDLRVIAVYQSDAAVMPLLPYVEAVKADYSDINWNFVYALVNNDLAILEPYQRSVKVLEGFKAIQQKIPMELQDYFRRFRGTYLELVRSTTDLINKNAELQQVAETQQVIGMQTIAGLVELKELLDRSQDKVNAYEALLSESYSVTFGGFYPERPRVLYIKQIAHVPGMDTFLSLLFAVISKQYRSSCKVVKLVDASNALHMRYVPNNYVAVTDAYNTAELLTNEFLMKLGAYNVMFDTFMLNRSGLEYLIVHDMRGGMGSALDPMLIDLRINEISADYAVLGEYDNVFSDATRGVAFPWSFRECQKYTGSSTIKLANHPTIGAVLDQLF